MSQINSQEQLIYRYLADQIQLGFYREGETFPSAKEIAAVHQVSYCPVQRALKALERDGLIELSRGRKTVVLKKPYENYMESEVFKRRLGALADLCRSLELISSSLCLQGLSNLKGSENMLPEMSGQDDICYGRTLYHLFEVSLKGLGNGTVMNLYYDIFAFSGSSFRDILLQALGEEEAAAFWKDKTKFYMNCLEMCQNQKYSEGRAYLRQGEKLYYEKLDGYLQRIAGTPGAVNQEEFSWEPYKGRTKYCDSVAIDMVCKINHGIYPVGALLPGISELADIYHVSEITVRRMIRILNQLGVVSTQNGIGTYVVCAGDERIPYKLKELRIDNNLRVFLEAVQLLAVIGEEVMKVTFPYCTAGQMESIANALAVKKPKASMVSTVGACLRVIALQCPFAALREIFGKITLLLLNGSILRLSETGDEECPGWSEIKKDLSENLSQRDAQKFAEAFGRLAGNMFLISKRDLLEIGVEGAAKVADLVSVEKMETVDA